MKNNLIYGVHIIESDLANELEAIVEDAYHYGATEANAVYVFTLPPLYGYV